MNECIFAITHCSVLKLFKWRCHPTYLSLLLRLLNKTNGLKKKFRRSFPHRECANELLRVPSLFGFLLRLNASENERRKRFLNWLIQTIFKPSSVKTIQAQPSAVRGLVLNTSFAPFPSRFPCRNSFRWSFFGKFSPICE